MTREEYIKLAQQIADLEVKMKNKDLDSEESKRVEAQMMDICMKHHLTLTDMMIIDEIVQNILS